MSTILMPGAPARAELDAIQARIAELVAEREAIVKSGLSEDEYAADIRRQVRNLRNAHPILSLNLAPEGRSLPHHAAQKVLAWTVALAGEDRVVDVKMEERRASGRPFGLAAAERTARLAEIADAVRMQSTAEEHATLALEAAGHQIVRRADIDGGLVLAIWRAQFGEEGEAA